jgi:uncharacterized protein (TIGR03083 family)
VEVARQIDHLESQGAALAAAARAAGMDTPVPTCPGWKVRDLLDHVGGVHRWAETMVSTARTTPTSAEEDALLFASVDDASRSAWFEDGLAALVAALRAAPLDLECWTFLPAPTPLAFWARRQCHETTVHAADAVIADAGTPSIATELATDGLDELLDGFFTRRRGGLKGAPTFSLSFRATDVERVWTIDVGQEGASVSDRNDGACRLIGSASELYLFAWNRTSPGALTVEGDGDVLLQWQGRATIRWG